MPFLHSFFEKKCYLVTFFCMASLLLSVSAQNQNLTVTPMQGTHIDTILKYHLQGEGVEISFGRFNNVQGVVQSNQIGSFNRNGFTSFPFETGLVMTTGAVTVAAGPNSSTGTSSSTGVISYTDQQLNSAGLATGTLNNCAALDFNFLAYTDTFSFNYVFGSEEYPNWVCSSYNDIFAFFLTGPDPVTGMVTTKNVAVIPGTITAANPNGLAVMINTVNAGAGSSGSPSTAGCYSGTYAQYYINNPDGSPGIQYNGYTTQLAAESRIRACENYSMHLAVCNVGDNSYDSGVFLEEQSFLAHVETKFMMRDIYCLGEDVNFTFTCDTADTIFIVTPQNDTLYSPFFISDVTAADSGWYHLFVHSALLCVDDWAQDSIFIQVLNLMKPDLGPDRYLCTGETMILNANYDNPIGQIEYHWSTGDETENIMVVASGEYVLNVEVFNEATQATCKSSDTIDVFFYPQVYAAFEANKVSGCSPMTIHFDNMTTPDTLSFTSVWTIWNQYGEVVYSSFEPSPTWDFNNNGTFTVKLLVFSQDGCMDSLIRWDYVHVYPQPEIDFSADPEIAMMQDHNGEVQFTSYLSANVIDNPSNHLLWDFGDGETEVENYNPSHTYATWGDYIVTLSLSTDEGCSDYVSHTIVIEDELIFPNIITPNEDGINDVWAVGNLSTKINEEDPDAYRHNELLIYNRWGKLVYKADNYDTYSVNGQVTIGEKVFSGEGLSDGVYYYSFYYKGKAKTTKYSGSLTIIR